MEKFCKLHWLALVATLVTASSLKMQTSADLSGEPASKQLWPHSMMNGGKTDIVPPQNLSAHLAWTWHHEHGRFGTVLAGGPVIDSDGNFYFTGQDHVRKLNSDGQEQWKYRTPSPINNMPALGDNALFLMDKGGHAIALNLETGKPLWIKQVSKDAGGDSGYPACSQGLFIVGSQNGGSRGSNIKISALDQTTGDILWDFVNDRNFWNFQPLFPGDDTVVAMDIIGGMYKLGLHDGQLIWHTPIVGSEDSFTDGGAVLGDNGMAYSCSNPGLGGGKEGEPGVLRAFQLSDGKFAWDQVLPQPCNSYPAFGLLAGAQEPSVVVTPGAFMGSNTMHGGIMAFDARTGALQWQYQAPVYTAPGNMAKGDVEGYEQRKLENTLDPFVNVICLPAHWGAPSITGDGKVYVGRSDGFLYSVRGPAGSIVDNDAKKSIDFLSTPGVEVNRFNAEGCSLHGSNAFAPGLMAFQTCDSLMVFKF